jgi:hypothetical protein
MEDNSCSAHHDNPKSLKDSQTKEVDYSTYESLLIAVPLIAPNAKPDRIRKNIYFVDDFGLNDKQIIGIQAVSSTSQLTFFNVNNVKYTVLTHALNTNISLSLYDRNKKLLALDQFPFAALISPAGVTKMKFPFHALNIYPDMKLSSININSITGFAGGTSYVWLAMVYYK